MDIPITKIVSGGQTGVDRAALDVAIFLELEHGGWCPLNRRAEDGPIPTEYRLKETPSWQYHIRTERNVVESDGTLILFRHEMTGGTALTRKLARKHQRPLLCVDLETCEPDTAATFGNWLIESTIQILNIAGPRESSSPGISLQTERILVDLFRSLDVK